MDAKTPTTEALTAGQVMSRVLVTIPPEESPLMAWEPMRRAEVHHLPVLDGRGRLIGMITTVDVLKAVAGRAPGAEQEGEVRTALFRIEPVAFSPRDPA
ncbi:CBS domain-containing protein [Planobispora takensis]|uniref:CBS domain-containing protein n=1 Tax=Planobispora takensis TaxID=1367882 RepID=A0A8J3T514_9ACTN|nr:CBS domain-containing protein [Planobispora takensis]GII05848.1 hypothetical protein Pta02_78560 [Planobispora takensis]